MPSARTLTICDCSKVVSVAGKGSIRAPPGGRGLGRRKGIAFSPQATPKSRCLNFADSQKGSEKSLGVVSTQTGQSSLTASCANSEVAFPTSENSATFITRQDFSVDSSGNSQEHAAEPFSRKGSSPSLPQCGYNSRVAPCCSAGGDSRFSLQAFVLVCGHRSKPCGCGFEKPACHVEELQLAQRGHRATGNVVLNTLSQHRLQSRRQKGSQQQLRVQPRTRCKYRDAVIAFSAWLRDEGQSPSSCKDHLDARVCEYLEWLFREGAHVGWGGDAICGCQFFLQNKRYFTAAWEFLRIWKRRSSHCRLTRLLTNCFLPS